MLTVPYMIDTERFDCLNCPNFLNWLNWNNFFICPPLCCFKILFQLIDLISCFNRPLQLTNFDEFSTNISTIPYSTSSLCTISIRVGYTVTLKPRYVNINSYTSHRNRLFRCLNCNFRRLNGHILRETKAEFAADPFFAVKDQSSTLGNYHFLSHKQA